jgi:hypothetical protein
VDHVENNGHTEAMARMHAKYCKGQPAAPCLSSGPPGDPYLLPPLQNRQQLPKELTITFLDFMPRVDKKLVLHFILSPAYDMPEDVFLDALVRFLWHPCSYFTRTSLGHYDIGFSFYESICYAVEWLKIHHNGPAVRQPALVPHWNDVTHPT